MTQAITVNQHAYSGGGIRVNHKGACTWENCGRFLAKIIGRDPEGAVNAAIDSVKREHAQPR